MALKMHPSLFVHPGPWLMRQVVEPYDLTGHPNRRASGRQPPEYEHAAERSCQPDRDDGAAF